jgi:DNA primase large subunit
VDVTQLARYPFLDEARQLVKEENVRTGEILHDPIYERARALGRMRVNDAIRDGVVGDYPAASETDALMNIFSYPIARIIVASVSSGYATGRYALSEAKRAYEHLQHESEELLMAIADEHGLEVGDDMAIYFTDYLEHAPTWSDSWKLVNMPLSRGWISLQKRQLARLLQNAIQDAIYHEVRQMEPPSEVRHVFEDEVTRLRTLMEERQMQREADMGEVTVAKLPPCIRQLLAAAQSGVNVPHVGRFTLVSFLHAVGMDTDDIVALFAGSPDFSRGKTRYQIEHITGKVSGTEYTPPSCSSIKSWGLCPVEKMDAICKRVKHPLGYYRIKSRARRNDD